LNFVPLIAGANAVYDLGTKTLSWGGFFLQLSDTLGTGVNLDGTGTRAIDAYKGSSSYQHGDVPLGGIFAAGFPLIGTMEWNTGGDKIEEFFDKTGLNDEINDYADKLESEGHHSRAQAFRYSIDAVTNPFQLLMAVAFYGLSGLDVGATENIGPTEAHKDGYIRFLNDMGFEKIEDTADRDVNVGDNINSLIAAFMMDGMSAKGPNMFTRGLEYFKETVRGYKNYLLKGNEPIFYNRYRELQNNPVEYERQTGERYEEMARENEPVDPRPIDPRGGISEPVYEKPEVFQDLPQENLFDNIEDDQGVPVDNLEEGGELNETLTDEEIKRFESTTELNDIQSAIKNWKEAKAELKDAKRWVGQLKDNVTKKLNDKVDELTTRVERLKKRADIAIEKFNKQYADYIIGDEVYTKKKRDYIFFLKRRKPKPPKPPKLPKQLNNPTNPTNLYNPN
jgi:DNA repair exonuclease SbcCD ATPase subunit